MRRASSPLVARRESLGSQFAADAVVLALRPLQALIVAPTLLFMAALAAMLLWHPDISFHEINRLTLGLLLLGVMGRAVVLRQRVFVMERASWPMLALIIVALVSLVGRPVDSDTWVLLGMKFIVPFALFHLAKLVFDGEKQLQQFEIFALVVLAYLSFTAVAFLAGARSLIFPRFILDPNLGYHADRARGPFLQAVANGVSLNLLGVLALHAYRRGSARGWRAGLLLASVPIAILATMTRAVWLSFAGTVLALIVRSKSRILRRAGVALALVAGLGLAAVLSSSTSGGALVERFEERQPVQYRETVYAAGWQMFLDRPLTGWGFHQMPSELPRYVNGVREKKLYPHNSYLEVAVELGLVGLALYVWLMWEMCRLGHGAIPAREKQGFLDLEFHRLWPVLLGIYWVNAAVVVMTYPFVNCLLFTMAGMLAAQRRRAEVCGAC